MKRFSNYTKQKITNFRESEEKVKKLVTEKEDLMKQHKRGPYPMEVIRIEGTEDNNYKMVENSLMRGKEPSEAESDWWGDE